MSLPAVTIVGNLTRDPELRFTPAGKAVTSLSVAANRSRKNEIGDWETVATTYLDVSVWGARAEAVADQLVKGSSVVIVGELGQRSYEARDGQKRTVYEVTAEVVAEQVTGRTTTRGAPAASQADPWATPGPADAPF